MGQSVFIITLGMAEIFVLLLGDIDLAAGYTAGCGAVIALWMMASGDPWWVSVLAALAATTAYGALQGIVVAKLRLPSFVVTLAGQLGLSGLILYLISASGGIGTGGTISLHNSIINDIENGQLSPTATWIVMIAIVAVAGGLSFFRDRRRRGLGDGRCCAHRARGARVPTKRSTRSRSRGSGSTATRSSRAIGGGASDRRCHGARSTASSSASSIAARCDAATSSKG